MIAWQKFLDNGNKTFVIEFDIAGAFGRVWYKGIIAKLKNLGITGALVMLLEDHVHGRTIQVLKTAIYLLNRGNCPTRQFPQAIAVECLFYRYSAHTKRPCLCT